MFSTSIQISDCSPDLPDLIRLADMPETGEVPTFGLAFQDGHRARFQLDRQTVEVQTSDATQLLGDVILTNPSRGVGQRIIRRASPHNTLLITERCDQLCVMCSQPPKDYELDLFDVYRRALPHAGANAVIGLSGGEPLLYKTDVFRLIRDAIADRPDLSFHVLTNAQHLTREDLPVMRTLPHAQLKFAVPLYAASADLHDTIVGKPGAFGRVLDGIGLLLEAGAEVEIRTVLMRKNAGELEDIARLLAWVLPDIDHWALMQLEYIGFARKNWPDIFFDHSRDGNVIRRAIGAAEQHGVSCVLYNMPLCTLPPDLHRYARPTISDWKQKFFDFCEGCSVRSACGGMFAWQPQDRFFKNMGPICESS